MSESFAASVWGRTSARHAMSKNLFALLISAFTAMGVAGFMVTAYHTQDWEVTWQLFVGVLVMSFAGIFIALGSDKPLVSLLGYGMVVVSMGAITGPVIVLYTTASVVKIMFITTAITVVLGIVGAVIPDSLESWGSWLLGGLLLLILGYFIIPVAAAFGVPVEGAMTLLDWAGVVIFSAYIIYDFNIAMRLERTYDNAIDVALAVFLDWINLFLRLLRLMGEKKSSS